MGLFNFLSSILPSVFGLMFGRWQQQNQTEQQMQLLNQEQQFTAAREDVAWNRSRPQQEYSDLLATGFNPNLAAQSVLGGASETASVGSSPQAPSVSSAIDAITSSLGDIGDKTFGFLKQKAEIENIQSQTDKNKVESGLMPLQFKLKQDEVNALVKKYESETSLNSENARLVAQQFELHTQIDPITVNQFVETLEKTIEEKELLKEQQKTQQKEREVMDADISLKHASEQAERGRAAESFANAAVTEQEYTHIETFGSRLGSDFISAIVGLLEKGGEDAFNQAREMASLYYQLSYKRKEAEEVASARHGKTVSPFQFLDKGFGLGRYFHMPWFDPYPGVVPTNFSSPVWSPTYHR